MAIELRWLTSISASSLHALAALVRGRALVDAQLAAALGPVAAAFQTEATSWGVAVELLLEHLVPLSAGIESNSELAKVALTKAVGRQRAEAIAPALARQIAAVEAAFLRIHPRAAEELALRAEPLKSQWEARGPGLLATVRRLTEPELIVSQADVILVQPVQGGGGKSHWSYNSVRIEALLANPVAELPEVVRLGWLLSQLNLDLPIYQGQLIRDRLLQVGALAMVPAVLAAAEQVELTRCDETMVARALQFWHTSDGAAEVLQWWETYRATRPPWTVALGALDRILTG